jgi:hypothetical protein
LEASKAAGAVLERFLTQGADRLPDRQTDGRAAGVSQVLRDHRETLVSVLETFVHDPLVEWNLPGRGAAREEAENPQAMDAMATIEGGCTDATGCAHSVSRLQFWPVPAGQTPASTQGWLFGARTGSKCQGKRCA